MVPGVDPQLLPDVVILVARATEGIGFILDPDQVNRAGQIALFLAPGAGEWFPVFHLSIRQDLQIERLLGHQPLIQAAFYLQGYSVRPHQSRFGRHNYVFPGQGRHGQRHGPIVADPALHEHFLTHRPGALDPIDIIHTDGVYQSGYDILLTDPLVISILDIRGDEGGALVVEIRRPATLHGPVGDLLHGNAERFKSGFLEERAGACRAGLVHGVIAGHPVGDISILGILPADLENGVHLLVEVDGGCGMGDNLVDHAIGEGVQAGDFAAGTGNTQPPDVHFGALELLNQRPVAAAGGAHRVAVGTQVFAAQDFEVRFAYQHDFGGGGTHIQAQDALVPGLDLAPFHAGKGDHVLKIT